jgi:hypothetical protein
VNGGDPRVDLVRDVKDRLENFDKDDHEDAQKNLEESKWKVRSGDETKAARGYSDGHQ